MKITKSQLKQIIKEELDEGRVKERWGRVRDLNIQIGDIIEAETPEERDQLQDKLVEYILSLEDELRDLRG